MRFFRIALSIATVGLAADSNIVPGQTPTSLDDPPSNRVRDPFEGVISPNLYDNMAVDRSPRRTERPATESGLVRTWSRLRRHSTAYRGAAEPFAEERSPAPAPYREPAASASRRPGQGDSGWFGGTARGADVERLRQGRPLGQERRAYGQWPMPSLRPGYTQPLRTIPDPMLQPPGRGAFGYGQGPGSGGPFGFEGNVITGGDRGNVNDARPAP